MPDNQTTLARRVMLERRWQAEVAYPCGLQTDELKLLRSGHFAVRLDPVAPTLVLDGGGSRYWARSLINL